MKEFHFRGPLAKTNVDSLSGKYHIKNSPGIEKYIMDFEILFHVMRVLPGCVVKGGMAATFHVDGYLKRLSEDVDLITHCTKEETEKSMESLRRDLEPLVDIRPHVPKNPAKRLPLLTYWCGYRSGTSPDSRVKLDIFYGSEEALRPETADGRTMFAEFTIDFPVLVYGHVPLIADKITTLAFQTIGLPEPRRHDAPKQIYDVASLLKSFGGTLPAGEVADALARASARESGYCQKKYSFDEVLADLEAFSGSMVNDELKLNPRDDGHLGTFKTQLLTTNYTRTEYVSDILLITLFIKLIRGVSDKTRDPGAAGIKMSEVLARLKILSGSNPGKGWRRTVVQRYTGQEKKLVAQLPSQQLYLYDCIAEADGRIRPPPPPPPPPTARQRAETGEPGPLRGWLKGRGGGRGGDKKGIRQEADHEDQGGQTFPD